MAREDDRTNAYRGLDRHGDWAIAELAERQESVVAVWQLKPLGYHPEALLRRARAGRLHRVFRGVYAVGHRKLSQRGYWMAAVLACGPDAVLSHGHAAALWDLRKPPQTRAIDVTVPGRRRRGQKGIRVHNVVSLHPEDRDLRHGIPVTSVHRTLLDLATVPGPQQLRLSVEAAERWERFDLRKLEALLDRHRGRPGTRALRKAVAAVSGPPPDLRSGLEAVFLPIVRDAGLPDPLMNVLVEGFLVDAHWPKRRLVVEIDSYKWHRTRRSFEDDRIRANRLQATGHLCLRFTDTRIEHDVAALTSELLAAWSATADEAA
jgi:hypothetical protein